MVAARLHLHWQDKVLVHHGALGKRLLIACVIFLGNAAANLLKQVNMVDEGNRHFNVTHHCFATRVVHLKTKPVRRRRETEIWRAPIDGVPIVAGRHYLLNAELEAGIDQNPHARSDFQAPWPARSRLKDWKGGDARRRNN